MLRIEGLGLAEPERSSQSPLIQLRLKQGVSALHVDSEQLEEWK